MKLPEEEEMKRGNTSQATEKHEIKKESTHGSHVILLTCY